MGSNITCLDKNSEKNNKKRFLIDLTFSRNSQLKISLIFKSYDAYYFSQNKKG